MTLLGLMIDGIDPPTPKRIVFKIRGKRSEGQAFIRVDQLVFLNP